MRHFLFFTAMIFFLIFSYGFVAPTLISYPDTIIVMGGIFYAAVMAPVVSWFMIVTYVKNAIKKIKGQN